MSVIFRSLSLTVIMAFLVAGWAEVSHALLLPGEFVVYVGERPYPSDFDPYYNQPKIYRQPLQTVANRFPSRAHRSSVSTLRAGCERPLS